MTDSNYTAIAVLLDRSGSMESIRSDAEGGLRQFIADQRAQPGRATLRLAQFDSRYEVVHRSLPMVDVPDPVLAPRDMTALLDSWGRAMAEFGEELAALPEDDHPGTVIFVVVTDGLENASREWTREQVFDRVKEQTDIWNWQFVFLAANQDAVAEGAKYGVPRAQTLTYAATSEGTQSSYDSLSAAVSRSRGPGGQSVGFTEQEREQAQRS